MNIDAIVYQSCIPLSIDETTLQPSSTKLVLIISKLAPFK